MSPLNNGEDGDLLTTTRFKVGGFILLLLLFVIKAIIAHVLPSILHSIIPILSNGEDVGFLTRYRVGGLILLLLLLLFVVIAIIVHFFLSFLHSTTLH